MKVGVTGATSEIGKALCRELVVNGIEVINFVRKPKNNNDRFFDLDEINLPVDLSGIDYLYHLAWIQSDSDYSKQTNEKATKKLITEASRGGVPVVFLSSVSVNFRDTSKYGASKFAVEGDVLKAGGVVVRSGMVWGGESAFGIFKSVLALRRIPFLCIHIRPSLILERTELRSLVERLIEVCTLNNWHQNPLQTILDSRSTSLEELFHFQRGHLFHFSLSARFIFKLANTLSSVGVRLPFRVDSLSIFLSRFAISAKESSEKESGVNTINFYDWLRKVI
jgi:hypothetical protein